MEKKIGKNVSSGAKKVERVEQEQKLQAEAAGTASKTRKPAKKSANKSVTKNAKKSAPAKKEVRVQKAVKQEKAAAEKRLEAAKKKAERKEKKLMKRAELKQKKLEKKARLQEKKLAKKEMIAKKKAERKQSLIDKKAALKEKRVERKAEKIARREMLKNESKAEKQKRIAREKKERLALKAKKRESHDRAREERAKAREAARVRKSENKKNKREHKTQRKNRTAGFGGWLAAVISLGVVCLALATVVTAGGFRMNDMNVAEENGYRATLYEMLSVSEDMDNNLSKLRVSSGSNEQRKLLTNVLVDSALLESALERIPVDAATGTDISAFVNKTNAYARRLLGKLAAGHTLTETERNTLIYLYNVNDKLCRELNELVLNVEQGELRAFLKGAEGSVSQKFGEMGQTSKESPEEIVDAPFSGEGNVQENRLSGLEEVSSARAEELLRGYLQGYHLSEVQYTGETAGRDMNCYNFVMTDESGVELFAQVTKNGGKLAFFDLYEACEQKNFTVEGCDSLAREFLKSIGIENVEAVWLSDAGMVADITYVSFDDGVLGYPDMIRVRVCESKGRVVGVDAKGYLLNYTDRDLSAGLSEAEVREMLSGVEAEGGRLALIPVDGEEVLAYEYLCTYGEDEYVIYLNAQTGEEEEVFIVRNGSQGRYLR